MGNDQIVLEVQKLAMIGAIIAAFVGGITGFLGSWIATAISTKAERRRQLLNIGFETGIRQWETMSKAAMGMTDKSRQITIYPPVTFIYFNVKAMEFLAEDKLTPETLSKLHKEQSAITKIIEDYSKNK